MLVRGEDDVDFRHVVVVEAAEEAFGPLVLGGEDGRDVDGGLGLVGEVGLVVLALDEVELAVVQAHEVLDGPLPQRVERALPELGEVLPVPVLIVLDGLCALLPQSGIFDVFLK